MKKRVVHYLILVAVVIVANFFIPRLLPGSPVKTLLGSEGVEELSARFGVTGLNIKLPG